MNCVGLISRWGARQVFIIFFFIFLFFKFIILSSTQTQVGLHVNSYTLTCPALLACLTRGSYYTHCLTLTDGVTVTDRQRNMFQVCDRSMFIMGLGGRGIFTTDWWQQSCCHKDRHRQSVCPRNSTWTEDGAEWLRIIQKQASIIYAVYFARMPTRMSLFVVVVAAAVCLSCFVVVAVVVVVLF